MKSIILKINKKEFKFRFKKDIFQKRRGKPKLLLLICRGCKEKLALYQKDGLGWLKRCYFDRLFFLPNLKNPKKSQKKFICLKCNSLLGKRTIFLKENRLAFKIDRKKLIRRKIR